MTHDPYIYPSGSEPGSGSSPSGAVPPYQQGDIPGVPPYQPGPASAPDGAFQAGPSSQGPQSAGPFGMPSQQAPFSQQAPYGQQTPFGQQPPQSSPLGSALAPAEERTWSIVAHLAPVVGAVLSLGWLNFIGPLVVYLLNKDRSPRVRAAAAGAFNFSATLWITNVVAWIFLITIIGIPVAILLWIAEAIALFVFHIWGAVNAANDQPFKYPLQIPILK